MTSHYLAQRKVLIETGANIFQYQYESQRR